VTAGAGTDHAAGRLQGLGLAVQLVAEALDVVQPVGDDNVVARQHPLDGRILLRPRILLGLGRVVHAARHAERLVVDEMDLEATDAGIAGRARDAGLEVVLELEGARRLARRGVAAEEDELPHVSRDAGPAAQREDLPASWCRTPWQRAMRRLGQARWATDSARSRRDGTRRDGCFGGIVGV
jgi:hypothetical protein